MTWTYFSSPPLLPLPFLFHFALLPRHLKTKDVPATNNQRRSQSPRHLSCCLPAPATTSPACPPCLWMRCRECGAPQGRVTTTTHRIKKKKKNSPAICAADISHTGQRARASGVHLLALAGFEVVLMSRRHVVLRAGAGVSRMTCVDCSRRVLLDCLLCACVCPASSQQP